MKPLDPKVHEVAVESTTSFFVAFGFATEAPVWTACTIGGAAVIFLFGLLLFLASLGPARPF